MKASWFVHGMEQRLLLLIFSDLNPRQPFVDSSPLKARWDWCLEMLPESLPKWSKPLPPLLVAVVEIQRFLICWLMVDINSDGKFDFTFEDTTAEDVTFSFPTPGTYSVTVIAVVASGAERARESKQVVVTGYRVEDRDGLLVLMMGANRKSGSNMTVIAGCNGDLWVTADRSRATVQAVYSDNYFYPPRVASSRNVTIGFSWNCGPRNP